jgi:hypothetical protein
MLALSRILRLGSTRNLAIIIALLACLYALNFAAACPFWSAPARTLSEDLAASDIVVFARLVEKGTVGVDPSVTATDQRAEAQFEITKVIKGNEHLADAKKIEAFYFGDAEPGALFLISGMVLPEIKWSTPLPLSERGEEYVSSLLSLPEKGPDRLSFFWQFLEDGDSLLAQDSYDEFARASYSDVTAMKGKLDRERLIDWINSPDLAQSRRRLYFTLLGVCGEKEDIAMLEDMMKSKDRKAKAGLDALIGCYLALDGPQGMSLVEELFLKKKDAEYADTYAAIMAIRVMGQESEVVPRARLLEALHYMLDRPDLADLVIPDLARWEDWAVMDRMVQLFKDANPGSNFVRVPVVNYLEAASRQKNEVGEQAKSAIDELTLIDPEAVKRAKAYAIFGPLASPKPAPTTTDKTPAAADGEKKGTEPVKESAPAETAKPKKSAETAKPAVAPTKSSSLPQTPESTVAVSTAPQSGLLVVPTTTSASPLEYVACGGSTIDQPSVEPATPAVTLAHFQQPATEDSAGPTPSENKSSPTNVEVAAEKAAPAQESQPKEALKAEIPVEETVAVVETETSAPPPAGQVLDLDRSIGKRRIGVMIGLIVAVLLGLRFISNRVGAPAED